MPAPRPVPSLRLRWAVCLQALAWPAAALAQAPHTAHAAPEATATVTGLPGLPVASGPSLDGTGDTAALPPELAALLLARPSAELRVPGPLRQAWTDAPLQRHAAADGSGAVYVDRSGAHNRFWLRHFAGRDGGASGVLVQMRASCRDLSHLGAPAGDADVLPAQADCARAGAGSIESGLRAYRLVPGQPPQDVTAALAYGRFAGARRLAGYERIGGTAYLDDSRAVRTPVLRWVMEFDPDRPPPARDRRLLDAPSSQAHLAFLVWTGERWELRERVPRALWPCEARGAGERKAAGDCKDPFVDEAG